jgi:hypothetical protein
MLPIAAILSIGEKVLDRVLPNPEAKAKALAELAKLEQDGKLAELQADTVEAQEVTKRLQADMSSDSWLSKNVRPMTLVALLMSYFIFASVSAFGINVNQVYVELLGQMIMLIVSFYFGGRTLEKLMEMKKDKDAAK